MLKNIFETEKYLKEMIKIFPSNLDEIDSPLERNLNENGWFEIAAGQNGKVFENGSKKFIIKITQDPDVCYEAFVDIVKNNPHKCFPEIYSNFTVSTKYGDYYVYMIEKLYPLDNDDLFIGALCVTYFYQKFLIEDEKIEFLFERQYPDIAEAIQILIENELFDDPSFHNDLENPYNYMQRNDGTVVLIDPVIYNSFCD